MNNPEKRVATASDGGERNFNRLPNELLLQIFKNLLDFKTLCFSSLVCKRFASIIPHVDHVYLYFPQSKPDPTNPINPTNNTQKPISSNFGEFYAGATRFLKKFDEIRSLYPYRFGANLLFKWKVVFEVGGSIEKFVFLYFSSIHKKEQNINNNEEEETESPMEEATKLWCVRASMVCYAVLMIFASEFPLLDRVTIADPNKHGMICLSKEKLIEIRGSSCSSPKFDKTFLKPVKQWYMAEMELRSWYIVKGVKLVIMGIDGFYADGDLDDGNVIPTELGVGDEVFGEAMKEIMLND